jgi:hypothetical protein
MAGVDLCIAKTGLVINLGKENVWLPRATTLSPSEEVWGAQLLVETGPEADARRAQALPLWREDASRRLDTFASGPDHAIDE